MFNNLIKQVVNCGEKVLLGFELSGHWREPCKLCNVAS